MNYTLEELRERINHIDKAILNAILQRIALIPLVSEIKKCNNLDVYQPEREKKILSSFIDFAKNNGLETGFMEELFSLFVRVSKDAEKQYMDNDLESPKVFETIQIQDELLNLFNASFQRLLEFNSIMDSMKKWNGDANKYGSNVDFIAILTDCEMNNKLLQKEKND